MGGSVGIKYAKNAPDPTGGNSLHFPRPLTQGQMVGGKACNDVHRPIIKSWSACEVTRRTKE